MQDSGASTNILFSFASQAAIFSKKWKEVLPRMPTRRMCAAVATTSKYLVVVGGESGIKDKLVVVEVMKMDICQWFRASSLPQPLSYPQMTLCNGCCYVGADSAIFSCSVDTLLMTAQLATSHESTPSLWVQRANVPAQVPGLTTARGQLLAIGGKDGKGSPMGTVHRFDPINESWSVVGWMPTPRSHVLSVALPSEELVVVGGIYGSSSLTTEIGKLM